MVSSRSVIRAHTVVSSSSSMDLTEVVALSLFLCSFSFFLYLRGGGELRAPVFAGLFLNSFAFPLRSFWGFFKGKITLALNILLFV